MASRRATVDTPTPSGPLRIQYVRLADAVLWDRNAKLHDMGGIILSIRLHGFRDAPIFDHTLGAIVAGNGRTTALHTMQEGGEEPPEGIVVDSAGEWWMPVQVGIDSPSLPMAEAFGVDHNALTASGGNLGFPEMVSLFDHDRLVQILESANVAGVQVVTFDPSDLEALLHPPPPADRAALGRGAGDGVQRVTCPECGHVFTRTEERPHHGS